MLGETPGAAVVPEENIRVVMLNKTYLDMLLFFHLCIDSDVNSIKAI